MKDIINSIKGVHALMESQMPFIKSEINTIIQSKSTDVHKIETLLDTLLDYRFAGIEKKEFKKLNTYYATFDKEASDDWIRIEKDFFED